MYYTSPTHDPKLGVHAIVLPPGGFQGMAVSNHVRGMVAVEFPVNLRCFDIFSESRHYTLENKIDYLCSILLNNTNTAQSSDPIINTHWLLAGSPTLRLLYDMVLQHFGLRLVISPRLTRMRTLDAPPECVHVVDTLFEFLANPKAYVELSESPRSDNIWADRDGGVLESYFHEDNVKKSDMAGEPHMIVSCVSTPDGFFFDDARHNPVPMDLLNLLRDNGVLYKVLGSAVPTRWPHELFQLALEQGFFAASQGVTKGPSALRDGVLLYFRIPPTFSALWHI